MKKRLLSSFLLSLFFLSSLAVNINVEPPNWWIGFEDTTLQLMIYSDEIGNSQIELQHELVYIDKIHRVENDNYVFVDLVIPKSTQACDLSFTVLAGKGRRSDFTYSLLQRNEESASRLSFTNSDNMYLLMPDRFANGDTNNDQVYGYLQAVDRKDPGARHGGDIQGIIEHLDYIKDLGFTALWINPVLDNNMDKYSYHGYAITDFYEVDPRLGSNDLFVELINKSHQKGMKVIVDFVLNHFGSNHWWMNDFPMTDWVHQSEPYLNTNYKISIQLDPYVSTRDSVQLVDGWFVPGMPDFNQRNPFVEEYLIQNTIWWIEYSGMDGIRLDTQPYAEKGMVSRWAKAINTEYPNFNILGEIWLNEPAFVSYFQGNNKKKKYNSHIPYVFDFPLNKQLVSAFNEKDDYWDHGLIRLHKVLGQDFLYDYPEKKVLFLDNHDVIRYMSAVDEDVRKMRLAFGFIYTTRGLPMVYYGTEILMTGDKNNEDFRKDFPGGWKEDKQNGFTLENMKDKRLNEMNRFVKQLNRVRSGNIALQSGQLVHFVPEDETYVYFRFTDEQMFMMVLNNSEDSKELNLNRFKELIPSQLKLIDRLNDVQFEVDQHLFLYPKSFNMFEVVQ